MCVCVCVPIFSSSRSFVTEHLNSANSAITTEAQSSIPGPAFVRPLVRLRAVRRYPKSLHNEQRRLHRHDTHCDVKAKLLTTQLHKSQKLVKSLLAEKTSLLSSVNDQIANLKAESIALAAKSVALVMESVTLREANHKMKSTLFELKSALFVRNIQCICLLAANKKHTKTLDGLRFLFASWGVTVRFSMQFVQNALQTNLYSLTRLPKLGLIISLPNSTGSDLSDRGSQTNWETTKFLHWLSHQGIASSALSNFLPKFFQFFGIQLLGVPSESACVKLDNLKQIISSALTVSELRPLLEHHSGEIGGGNDITDKNGHHFNVVAISFRDSKRKLL